MKKIIALALALIMALSMASVAFAATTELGLFNYADIKPGEKTPIYDFDMQAANGDNWWKSNYKVSYDFTKGTNNGASYIESIKFNKDNELVLQLKESYTLTDGKAMAGTITLTNKADKNDVYTLDVTVGKVANELAYTSGAKKAADAEVITAGLNKVTLMDEDGGFVKFVIESDLTGTVKMGKEEKAYLNTLAYATKTDAGYETKCAIDEFLGEDYEAIVEYYIFETRAFKEAVDFRYDAYAEDDHFFYQWDGEKLVDLEAKYDDDEDVDDYVFTAAAEGTIIVTDKEIVLAAEEETKNPDTGANDVVGVAAALAVVSLVAAGAVSLKK